MARTHAKLLCSIWADSDFTDLSADAQRMFMLVISQPKLSMCGVIDYVPSRWARFAPGMTADDVEILVDELERRRFLHVDREHAELLVRSFVRNDGLAARWQMLKAVWSAWDAVSSPALRELIVESLPDEAWNDPKASPSANAIAIRAAIRFAPECDPEQLKNEPASAPARASIDAARAQLKAVGQ